MDSPAQCEQPLLPSTPSPSSSAPIQTLDAKTETTTLPGPPLPVASLPPPSPSPPLVRRVSSRSDPHSRPSPSGRDVPEELEELKVSPLELFLDLVIVSMVSRVVEPLHERVDDRALVLFAAQGSFSGSRGTPPRSSSPHSRARCVMRQRRRGRMRRITRRKTRRGHAGVRLGDPRFRAAQARRLRSHGGGDERDR